MVFVKHNSLKSDISFNPIFIPGFSGSRFFRVQVFQGPGFSGSRFFRVLVQDPGPGSRVRVRVQGPGPGCRVRVQGTGPGFRSSPKKIVSLLIMQRRVFLQKNAAYKTVGKI